MDFGKILDDWELENRKNGGKENKNDAMRDLVERFGPNERDIREKEKNEIPDALKERRRELLRMKPGRTIDLHGLSVDEAIRSVDAFLKKCKADGVKKVLIIHGKGLHSDSDPILGKMIVRYIQKCRFAGEYGVAPRELGGRGATWLILR